VFLFLTVCLVGCHVSRVIKAFWFTEHLLKRETSLNCLNKQYLTSTYRICHRCTRLRTTELGGGCSKDIIFRSDASNQKWKKIFQNNIFKRKTRKSFRPARWSARNPGFLLIKIGWCESGKAILQVSTAVLSGAVEMFFSAPEKRLTRTPMAFADRRGSLIKVIMSLLSWMKLSKSTLHDCRSGFSVLASCIRTADSISSQCLLLASSCSGRTMTKTTLLYLALSSAVSLNAESRGWRHPVQRRAFCRL